MKKLNKEKLNILLVEMLGEEFIDFFVIDISELQQIEIFVKTTSEFIWGERFSDDLVYDYLGYLGYTHISVIASTSIKGGVWRE